MALFRPEDIHTMCANEGRLPVIQGFEFMDFMRSTSMRDRYLSLGLLSNGEDWLQARSKVQQDMMQPRTAVFFLDDIEDIAEELVDKINEAVDDDDTLDPHSLLQQFSLEAVGSVFLGARLGALGGGGDGERIVHLAERMLPLMQKLMLLPRSIVPYLPIYSTLVQYQTELFDITKKHVDASMATAKDDSLLARMTRRCGQQSSIPLVMAVDSLQVGIDTTSSTAVFLLYHLATNPEKQEKLFREIQEELGEEARVTETSLTRLRYLKACLTESQRMLPAIFGTTRQTTVSYVLTTTNYVTVTAGRRCCGGLLDSQWCPPLQDGSELLERP